ncbi:hypothetical protein [Falsihalocynthiibacter arcticus]|uniref:Uncharacterized protein n=1 Tax=Falsihalocynthiibacter arcticus TaxID=1579316 RepID=A0A126UV11_9RHOB|nr:hypothetical protein [Falsihalocynthiibacter arcticus]AML49903.1 hypothetical protein RC74_00145 [Falsihalocynthiibacter arcticus]
MKFAVYLFAATIAAQSAFASCPTSPPETVWNTHDGDQHVNAEYLQKILAGNSVKYGREGTEYYNNNGTYVFSTSAGELRAPSYKYYEDGTRCINTVNPRFDLFVVNDRRLILITNDGTRLEGQIKR